MLLEDIHHNSGLPNMPKPQKPPSTALNVHLLSKAPSPDPPTTNHLSGLLKDFDDDISFYSYYRPSDLNENKDEAEETVPEVIPKWNIDHSIFRARKFGESDRYVPKMFVFYRELSNKPVYTNYLFFSVITFTPLLLRRYFDFDFDFEQS